MTDMRILYFQHFFGNTHKQSNLFKNSYQGFKKSYQGDY